MPRTLSLASAMPGLSHDPTVTINGDPMGFVGDNPYAVMTDAILFGAVNTLLEWIDDATGLDLLAIVQPLEDLLGAEHGLLSGLLDFLNPADIFSGTNVFTKILSGGKFLLDLIPNIPAAIITGLEDFGMGVADFLGYLGIPVGADPIATLFGWGQGLLNIFSPLDADNLFNFGNIFGRIPIGHLTSDQVELLDNPDFREAVSLQGGGIWTWDSTVGRTVAGSAKVSGTGALNQLISNSFAVSEGDALDMSVWAQWSGLTYTGTAPLKLQVVKLLYDSVTQAYANLGTTDIAAPASPPTNQATWQQFSGSYTVPSGVSHLSLQIVTGANATAGTTWWDDASAKKSGLIEMPWISGIFGALDGAGQQLRDAISQALGGTGTGHTNTDVFNFVGTLPNAFTELQNLFSGSIFAPVSTVADALDGFLGLWFRGGPQQVVVAQQMAAPSGVLQMDSDARATWDNLPPELMNVAIGYPWVEALKTGSNQTIPASTDTLVTLTGGSQTGPTALTFSGNKWKFPFDGMWNIEVEVAWDVPGPTTTFMAKIFENGTQIRYDERMGTGRNKFEFMYPAATTDEFAVWVNTAASGKNVTPAGTFVRATYIGQTTVPSLPPPPDPVTVGSVGAGNDGGGNISWSHTFSATDNAIAVPISHESGSAPTVTISGGAGTVPIVSGPTFIGTYFGNNARASYAAGLLPAGVAGTTRTITVSFPGGNAACSANSVGLKGVGTIGTPVVNSGTGSPNLFVPSNVSSIVVCQFGGMDVGFSSFNRTSVQSWGFAAFDTWAHQIGYSIGGQKFTATNSSKWCAKGVEFHP